MAGPLITGSRTYLREPSLRDRDGFLEKVRRSRRLHRPWSHPPDVPERFSVYLRRTRKPDFQALWVHSRDNEDLIGVYNLSQIFLGTFQNAFLGYYAFAGLTGKGLMTEGLALTLRFAFRTLGLHRLEANIQPGNSRSIALVQRCGFRKEGYSPKYLKIGGQWRDHERWAITTETWKEWRKRA